MVLAFLPESLTKSMRIENAAEQKKTRKRYEELRETMRKNPDYVPNVDDRYILQLNQGGYLSLICNHDVLVSCIIYGKSRISVWSRHLRQYSGRTGRFVPDLADQLARKPRLRADLVRPWLAVHRCEPHADLLHTAAVPPAHPSDDQQAGFLRDGLHLLAAAAAESFSRAGQPLFRDSSVDRYPLLLRTLPVLPFLLRHISHAPIFIILLASFTPLTAWSSSPTAPIKTSEPKSTDWARSCPPSAALWYFFDSLLSCRDLPCARTCSRGHTRTVWASRSTMDVRSMWGLVEGALSS